MSIVLEDCCTMYYLRIASCIADLASSRIIIGFWGCYLISMCYYNARKIILFLLPDIDANLCIIRLSKGVQSINMHILWDCMERVVELSYALDFFIVVGVVGKSGCIFVLWRQSYACKVICYLRNFINLEVEDRECGSWRRIGFYGIPTRVEC